MADRFVNLPDISIRQLEYLVAVDESATWADAAARVGVSGSALSQGLAELERRIGVPLFEREGRARVLRPAGRHVVSHATRVLAMTADLERWADRINGGSIGRARIGMIDTAATFHFSPAVREFHHRYPDTELTLSVAPSATLIEMLSSGHLDLAIAVEPLEPVAGVTFESLIDEPLKVVGGAGVTSVGAPSTWGPWVTYPIGSHTRSYIRRALAEQGAPFTVAAESNQPDVLIEMVRMGLGWAVLPEAHLTPDLETGPTVAHRRLSLARRNGAVIDPANEVLLAAVRAAANRSSR